MTSKTPATDASTNHGAAANHGASACGSRRDAFTVTFRALFPCEDALALLRSCAARLQRPPTHVEVEQLAGGEHSVSLFHEGRFWPPVVMRGHDLLEVIRVAFAYLAMAPAAS